MKAILNGKFYILIIFFMIISCKSQVKQDTFLNDLNYEQIIIKKGKPSSENTFSLNKNKKLYEYQSTLYDLLKGKKSIEVRELKWVNKDILTVVWLVKKDDNWVSVDNIVWNNKKIKM